MSADFPLSMQIHRLRPDGQHDGRIADRYEFKRAMIHLL
jgi:hypothetical protein